MTTNHSDSLIEEETKSIERLEDDVNALSTLLASLNADDGAPIQTEEDLLLLLQKIQSAENLAEDVEDRVDALLDNLSNLLQEIEPHGDVDPVSTQNSSQGEHIIAEPSTRDAD